MDLSRWTNQATPLNLHTLMEIAINLSTRRVSTGWNSPYCEIMDKFTVISISVKLRNLKQYLWLAHWLKFTPYAYCYGILCAAALTVVSLLLTRTFKYLDIQIFGYPKSILRTQNRIIRYSGYPDYSDPRIWIWLRI